MGQNLSVSRVVTAKAGRRFFSKKPKDGDEENKRLSLENVADELTDSSLVSSASTVEVSAVEDSTVKDSPTFHPFPRLAAELRLKIWELAAVHRHQVVELIPVETCMKVSAANLGHSPSSLLSLQINTYDYYTDMLTNTGQD